MPEPLNPNFCCGCTFWNYRCTAPDDQPCGNVTTDKDFIRTAHTRKDVEKTIKATLEDIRREAANTQEKNKRIPHRNTHKR